MRKISKIHDSGYKKLFSDKGIFRQLLETFVAEDWVKDLDFSTCEILDKSFISDHYKETECDLIYKVKLKQKDIFIIILMEFQSTVDRFMSLRILNYITNFYMDYLESHKKEKMLPAVFPILLYNGNKKWTAPVNISELITGNEHLGKYSLNFEYFKIAENEYSREELLKIKNVVSTLFLTEAYYDADLLADELVNVFENETDKAAVSLLINWFKQLMEHSRIPEQDYKKLEHVYKNKEEVHEMLVTALKKERKKIFTEGKVEGKVEGKIEHRNEIVKKMLTKGFEIAFISEVVGISEAEILKLKIELEKN